MRDSRDHINDLSERRQQAWRDVEVYEVDGARHVRLSPLARHTAKAHTAALNGRGKHHFEGHSGAWGALRITRATESRTRLEDTLDYALGEGWDLETLTDRHEQSRALVVELMAQADILNAPPPESVTDSGGFILGRETSGGTHDYVWLLYFDLEPLYPLAALREALGRNGRPHGAIRDFREEAQRLVIELRRCGVATVELARFFGVNKKTIERTLSVAISNTSEGIELSNTEVLERIDRLEGRLAEALNGIQSSVYALLDRYPEHEGLRDAAEGWLDDAHEDAT